MSCGTASAKDEPEDLARPLLKSAADRALLLPSASSPFKLLVDFEVHGGGSAKFKGQYSWLVTPAGNSRKQTKVSDFDDLEVLKGSTLWVKRNLDFMPLQAAWVEYAMSNFRLITSGFPVERYFKASEHHIELHCVEVKQGKNPRTLCLDADGNLRKAELQDLKLIYEYSDYRPVGSKFAPQRMVLKRDGGTVLDAEVVSLTVATPADENAIEIPGGAQRREGCLDASLPSITKSVPPNYPKDARDKRQQGEVIAYALITSNGTLAHTTIVQTAGTLLDDSVLAAASQWQYEPARCENTPVESEALVPVRFTLEFH